MPQRNEQASRPRPTGLPLSILSILLSLGAVLGPRPGIEAQTPPATQRQTPTDIVVELEGNQRPRLRLAFPGAQTPAFLTGNAQTAVQTLEQTLRDDLDKTGIFEIQGPEILSVLKLTGKREVDFELYRSLVNEVVLLAEIKLENENRIVLEGRIFDLKSARSILGKRYRGDFGLIRRIAHTFTDEIVLYFSGRKGIALTTLAFVSDRHGNRQEPYLKELYLMDYDGHRQRRISGHRSITMSPSWSRTGTEIAYVSFFGGSPAVYSVDLASGTKRPVINDDAHNMSPTFSPDGEWISFARSLAGNSEIFIVHRDGTRLRQLTHSAGIDTNPAWSPSGREIAFTSSRTGTPQIYLVDAEGTNPRRITFKGDYNDGAAWHPDGTKLAYAARDGRTARYDIVVVDVVTLEGQVLTSGRASHEAPSFSPDGRHIAFELTRRGNTQVFIMDVDGQNFRQLTSEGENFAPAWSNYLN